MTGEEPRATAPARTADKKAAPQKRSNNNKKIIIALCVAAAVLLLAVICGFVYYLNLTADNGLIFANVYVAGIDLGGMTPEEASNVLHLATDSTYTQQDMIIQLPDQQLILSPADTKVSLDVDAIVTDAYNYGRTGSRLEQYMARQDAVLTSYTIDLIPYLNLDTEYLRSAIEEAAAPYNTTLIQPSVTITGERPPLAKDEIDEDAAPQVLTLTMGIPHATLDASALYGMVVDAYSSNQFLVTPEVPITQPEAPDLEAIYLEYCVEPIDAAVNEEDYSVFPEVYGYGFDIALLQEMVDAAEPGQALEIELHYLAPEITKEAIESTLFQDVLGTYKAYQASSADRATNLKLACQAINGLILRPGDTFSFNDAVGERTEARGYRPAAAYMNGKTVQEFGGGICQVSSALYYCALLGDLEIVRRTNHSYPSSYVPIGLDATVSWGSPDFRFRNNTDYPIRIEASASGGTVYMTLYGTDTKDYYIKLDSEILETYDYEVIYQTMPEDNEEGYKDGDIIQDAHTGYKAVSYRLKYDKETDRLLSKDVIAYSNYRMTDKIICKIEVPEPAPPVTDPPVTDPPVTDPPVTDPSEPPAPTEPDPTEPDPSETTEPGLEGPVGDSGGG